MTNNDKWLYLFLVLLCLNLFLFNGQISLWDEDEAAYAGFASEMLSSGNWVQPDFLWSRIHRKTPLHFWNIAISYKLFGVSEWSTRFSSALSVLGTCGVLFWMGKGIFGRAVAGWAVVVLSSSLLIPLSGKIALTDASLIFFQTTAMLALFRYLIQPNWRWNLLFWVAMAFGFLAKGPPILVLCGGAWLFLAIFHPFRKNIVGTHPWFFGLLALVPLGTWLYLSWQQDDGALVTFLYEWYVVQRIGGSVLGQTGLPGYHLIVILIAFLPWMAFLLPALLGHFRTFFSSSKAKKSSSLSSDSPVENKGLHSGLFISSWLLFGWLFFELMSSKLPSYAFGAHPAIALLIAQQIVWWLDKGEQPFSKFKLSGWLFSLLLILVIAIGLPILAYHFILPEFYFSYFFFSFSLVFVLGIQVYFWVKRKRKYLVLSLGAAGWAMLFLIISCIVPIIENSPIKSLKEVSEAVIAQDADASQPQAKSPTLVAMMDLGIKQTKISLPFYLSQHFQRYEDWSREVALAAFLKREPLILVVNRDGLTFLSEALEKRNKMSPTAVEIDWWSTDDKLRGHSYFVLRNF